jgi:uncharacterized protein (TIGR03435 family)
MTPDLRKMDEVVKRHLPVAPTQATESAGARVLDRLRSMSDQAIDEAFEDDFADARPVRRIPWRPIGLAAAAAVIFVFPLLPGADHVYTTTDTGRHITLSDGSRVEMRAQSELSVDRADDGLRIRLDRGGIIVHAARQRTGHLYVETKDVAVSVVGTVFLVNAGEEGSRVAVIEGEVRVQQGGTAKKLLPGEQVSTNPRMETRDVRDVIAWSRNSVALLALLQQSAVVPAPLAPQVVTEPRDEFEVASIRPRPSLGGGGRGTGGSPCVGRGEIDPRRFVVTNTTLHNLIGWAYGVNCLGDSDGLSGGPGWIRSDRFDLEARMPDGFPSYTMIQVRAGNAPRLQSMLQVLLADRFKLVVRREMTERSIYVLTATATPRLTASKDGDEEAARGGFVSVPTAPGTATLTGMRDEATNVSFFSQRNASGQEYARLQGKRFSMARLANALGMPGAAGRLVLDRTGIAGEFNIDIQFVPHDEAFIAMMERATGAAPNFMSGPSLFVALEEQLGLRLEAIRAPVETLVVEQAEKPTEN